MFPFRDHVSPPLMVAFSMNGRRLWERLLQRRRQPSYSGPYRRLVHGGVAEHEARPVAGFSRGPSARV